MNNVVEALGLLCLVAFAYLLFPPAALAVAGVVLVLYAQVIPARRARRDDDDSKEA